MDNYSQQKQALVKRSGDIKEGDEFFVHTPAHGGSSFITPIQMLKSPDGKLFSVSPAYSKEQDLRSVLKKSLLRRDNLEIELLIKKIGSFVSGQSNYTLDELKEFVHKIMSVDDFGTYLQYNRKSLKIVPDAELFRVIPLLDEGGNFKKDFNPLTWRTVSPYPSLQRLNTDSESALYTANVDRVAMEEAGIVSKNEKFAMFIYRPKIDIELLPIQSNMFLNPKFPKEYREYGLQTTRMLNEVFSTPSSGNREHDKKVYELSNYIKERYLSLNRYERYKGWSYTSIKFKEAIDYQPNYTEDNLDWLCIAFPKETYEQCLDLEDVTCVLFNCTDDDMEILNLSYSTDINSKNKIIKGELK